ncbi:hypothetical protein Bhyg_15782, partial [Pseudolycoriella hygida]
MVSVKRDQSGILKKRCPFTSLNDLKNVDRRLKKCQSPVFILILTCTDITYVGLVKFENSVFMQRLRRKMSQTILFGLILSLAVGLSLCSLDIKVVLEQPIVTPFPDVVATSLVLTFSPGDEGSPPHYHSGPVIGYVFEGSFLFQVANELPRIIPAGGTFYEYDRATHVWGANAADNSTCQVLVTIYGRPGEPILTLVDDFPRSSRSEALALARSQA